MARPLRIEYPGAWYHIMNRGRHREKLFDDVKDYRAFISILRESTTLLSVGVAAYCLMPNHYHLLVHTPLGNLSRFMRRVGGVYAQQYNHRHGLDGALFKGRYKSILVEADAYLLQLVRYIHMNPLEAGIVSKLDEYEWSSHKGYVSSAPKWSWLSKEKVLSMLGSSRSRPAASYLALMRAGNPEEVADFYSRKKISPILGGEDFLEWVREQFSEEKTNSDVPDSDILAPDVDKILETVSRAYRVDVDTILQPHRGKTNEARLVAIYLMRKCTLGKTATIASRFRMSRHTSVCSAVARTEASLRKNPRLAEIVHRLESLIKKRQETT